MISRRKTKKRAKCFNGDAISNGTVNLLHQWNEKTHPDNDTEENYIEE
jgi:hypothetical protein